jgi:hypothetical protein
MRAGVSVDGLARRHDVSVAVVKHQDEDDDRDAAALAWTRDRVTAAIVVPHAVEAQAATSWLRTERGRAAAANPLPEFARRVPPALGDTIADELGTSFDVVMVMRTYLAGAAVPFLEEGLSAILDADDDDARTFESIGLLGEPEGKDAAKYSDFQRIVLPWFDRVLFASAEDALAPFEQLPNAVRVPPVWTMRAPADPLELLFVGNLGYPPNRDALDRLNARIVPAIADMGIDVRLHHPAPDDEIAPFYERAHIAVVPLRAGGGTSIKILEAFAHGCPVVASPTGARGLEVADDDQLVITDDDADDEGFASAVVALARDDRRRARLAATARRFVVEHHDATAVGDELARLIDEVAAIGSPNEYEA